MSAPVHGALPGATNSALVSASQSSRQRILLTGLALTLAATAWVASREEQQEEGKASVSRPARAARVLPAAAVSGSDASPARAGSWPPALQPLAANAWPDAEPQVLQSWGLSAAPPVAAPPVQAKPAPQPEAEAESEPPAAPPLGYQLVGRMDEAQRPRIVLSNNLRTVVLAVGETLDQQWRLDAIGPSGAQFTWLAGGQKQSLAYP
ncbi:hypothetical protein [Paucibacter sp. Y2R2-4]|uniref:hypothetical protein n=1 Tax=Paucibacter sp. Y2R2-4 TaxID=2893553 RepID=UPI0021E379DE|nr:hypothetical protein [Paucibacter sp. Y2R2-4]MCV2349676.1 hypothetical protein [Paucibacter sp. Y2R2-4]